MNRPMCLVISLAAAGILAAAISVPSEAQVVGVGAKTDSADKSIMKSMLLLNREPILSLDLKRELVEILPGGINVLAKVTESESAGTSVQSRLLGGLRVGSNTLDRLRIDGGGYFSIETRLLQLDDNGLTLQVDVGSDAKTLLASKKLSLRNYEEVIIELASATAGNKRLAVRLLPSIRVIEPLRDYPSLVLRFGTLHGLLIRNSREVINRGGVSGTIDDPNGTKQQFCTLESSNSGLLVISYRPFPGAVIAGYFLDNELYFEWNGDFYEWISLDKPFLPDGRWAAYFWQAGPSAIQGAAFGGFESDPNNILMFLDQMRNKSQGVGGVKK